MKQMKDKKLRAALEVKMDTDGEISIEVISRLSSQIENLAEVLGFRANWDGSISKRK